jgi:hypothetical protein
MKRLMNTMSATLAAVLLYANISAAQVGADGNLAYTISNYRSTDTNVKAAERYIVRNRLDSGCCWTLSADAMIMSRSGGKTSSLLINADESGEDQDGTDASGAELFNSNAFEFNWAAGPRVSVVGEDILFGCDLEAAFFGIDGWEAVQNITVPETGANFMVFNEPSTTISLSPGDVVTYRYVSQLRSTEINARHPIYERLSVLMGFRYVELHEELASSVNDVEVLDANVDNHMYGGQIGMNVAFINTCRLSIEGVVKAGVLGNYSDLTMSVIDTDRLADKRTHTAFLGELGLMGIVQVTNQLAMRGGYQVMWLDGIAIAGDQVENVTPSSAKPYIGGTLFYHGAFAGLEYAW